MVIEELHYEDSVPSQRELKFLDELALKYLPHGPIPTLAEIQAQPDVKPLGRPQRATQRPSTSVRLKVHGTDAALSAVITKLMRADHMWMEVEYVPVTDSVAARSWKLNGQAGEVKPVPLIRDDAGIAVVGCATITEWDDQRITGEIIVDDHRLLAPGQGYGARLVPTLDAPGLAAARLEKRMWKIRPNPTTLAVGRALQVGGLNLRVEVDGVSRKRPVEKATFYRHLRDLQLVRP